MNLKSQTGRIFSREDLKQIRGGDDGYYEDDDEPSDDDSSDANKVNKRCCKVSNPSSCSRCIMVSSRAYCGSGSFITTSGCP